VSITCNNGEGGVEKVITNSTDKLVCPDPNQMCRKGLMCPNDCNNRGRCKSSGTCWCYPGYSGAGCTILSGVTAPTGYIGSSWLKLSSCLIVIMNLMIFAL
jgi:hypothetical protein